MNNRRPLSDAELAERLVELGGLLAWPAVPDLSPRVTAAIETLAAERPAFPRVRTVIRDFADLWLGGRRTARRSLVIAIVALLAIAAVAAALGLGVPGIRIELRPIGTGQAPGVSAGASGAAVSGAPVSGSPATISPAPSQATAGLDLGPIVSLDEARRSAGFAVLVPDVSGFGGPREVHLAGSAPLARVSLVYGPTYVTEFLGAVDPGGFQKIVGGGTTVKPITINGQTGYWITGTPHELMVLYRSPGGGSDWEVVQVSGNVLIWQAGPVTLRLQTPLELASATQIAGSAR